MVSSIITSKIFGLKVGVADYARCVKEVHPIKKTVFTCKSFRVL